MQIWACWPYHAQKSPLCKMEVNLPILRWMGYIYIHMVRMYNTYFLGIYDESRENC